MDGNDVIITATDRYDSYTPHKVVDDFSKYTSLLFISGSIKDSSQFDNYVKNDGFIIYYHFATDRESLMDYIKQFPNIERIAFVFHGPLNDYLTSNKQNDFIQYETFFQTSDLEEEQTQYSENILFMKQLITQFSLKNLDFLACNTLLYDDWKKYYAILQETDTNLVIGASDDNTGNIKYGGNWIM